MTDRELEMETNPNVLKLVKGEDHVWVDKGSDAEKLWRKSGFVLEEEATAPSAKRADAQHPLAHAPHTAGTTTADDKKLDSRGVVAEADRNKKDR